MPSGHRPVGFEARHGHIHCRGDQRRWVQHIDRHQFVAVHDAPDRFLAYVERLFIRDTLPTAFFCFNDDTAIRVIGALQRRGYRVPEDVSVIGFDDIPLASNVSPALTTIRQPRGQIGDMP